MQTRIKTVTAGPDVGTGEGLSREEIDEIREGLSHYPDNQAMSIEALKIVQRHRGWISSDSLKAIAAYLKLSPDEVEGVATFYNLVYRQRVGKHVIRVCDSVSCWMLGYDKVVATLKQALNIELGGTTPDNLFTLLPGPCLGACDHAPVLMVDDDYHFDVDADSVRSVLEPYQKSSGGEPRST